MMNFVKPVLAQEVLVDLDQPMKNDEDILKKIIELNANMISKWKERFPHRKSMLDIAREMFPIQPLPPGALPTYERDIDIANIVVPETTSDDLGFTQWVGPSEGLKGHQEIEEDRAVRELENWVAPELPPGDTPVINDDDDYIPEYASNGTVSVGKITIDVPGLEPILIDNSPPPNKNWIQTFTGRRFDPIDPVEGAIVIDDVAHSLSNQCRFTGHVKKFYSVAQHCVLVSYICDEKDALHGLLHDASEAYLVDIPRPLKRSGKFAAYLEMEDHLQKMIYKRFGLTTEEPAGVKRADTALLATEARDLMSPLHRDWVQPVDPLPFKIVPLPPQEAKDLFMKRFFQLTNHTGGYEHYLRYEYGEKDI
jgi:5'-deoxynucleotidase YfbR-like HD superfamily hydrolase